MAATWANQSRSTDEGYIRLEDTTGWFYLLLEDGGKLVLEVEDQDAFEEKTSRTSATFTNPDRTAASWTNQSLS